jgi:hypothetical protein
MKRFLVFSSDYYYPAGGWDDFRGDFDTAEHAFKCAKGYQSDYTWTQVIDTETKLEIHGVNGQ